MKKKQFMLAAALLALLLTVAVSGTLAYLIDTTGEVENVFTPSQVDITVDETFNNNVKSNVTIKNTGDVAAYIRAAIVVTWQDASGNVYGKMPDLDTDYSMTILTNTGWTPGGDGFYYYNPAVPGKVGDTVSATGVLISECKPLVACEDPNYTLHVEILAQAVQAEGMGEGIDTAQEAFAKAAENN